MSCIIVSDHLAETYKLTSIYHFHLKAVEIETFLTRPKAIAEKLLKKQKFRVTSSFLGLAQLVCVLLFFSFFAFLFSSRSFLVNGLVFLGILVSPKRNLCNV